MINNRKRIIIISALGAAAVAAAAMCIMMTSRIREMCIRDRVDIVPENFNSAEAMWEMIQRLQD